MNKRNSGQFTGPRLKAFHFVLGARAANQGIDRTAHVLIGKTMQPHWLAGFDAFNRIIRK